MKPPGIVARRLTQTAGTERRRSVVQLRTFLSATFALPFLIAGIVFFVLASQAPERNEANLVLSLPRPNPPGIERTDGFLDLSIAEAEVEPLRVFFHSPERMRNAMLAVDPRAAAFDEPRLLRFSQRLANQIRVEVLRTSPPERILVETTLWTTQPGMSVAVLRFLGDEIVRRYARVEGVIDRRLGDLRQRRDAQADLVRAKTQEIRESIEKKLPAGLDVPLDSLLEGDAWVRALRERFRAARTDEASESGEDTAVIERNLVQLAALRRQVRESRAQIAEQSHILEDLDKQINELADRTRLVDRTGQAPLEIVSGPTPDTKPRHPLWLAVVAASVGVAAGSLSLLMRMALAGPGRIGDPRD